MSLLRLIGDDIIRTVFYTMKGFTIINFINFIEIEYIYIYVYIYMLCVYTHTLHSSL
jgi:hypothetical protein